MQRYKATISYNGTNYIGWQIQPNGRSIQGEIEDVLKKIIPNFVGIVGCGRTDTGVHAEYYVFHFDSIQDVDEAQIKYKLNKMLADDVLVHKIEKVSQTFHARFGATSRSYEYRFCLEKRPFDHHLVMVYPYADLIDLDKLNDAATLFTKFNDFYTFCKTNTEVNTTLCRIDSAIWTYDQDQKMYLFRITADRFLRGQIRLMVGACLNVNRGRLSLAELEKCLNNKERLPIDWSVPACGLTLKDIEYR